MCVCVCVCPYHAVHSKVVVLGLQLHGVGVIVPYLRVAGQEQALVVHDPVKHLGQRGDNTHTHTRDRCTMSHLLIKVWANMFALCLCTVCVCVCVSVQCVCVCV